LPRGGLIRSRIAVGAEILGFTTAFLRGSGFFSLSESCDPIPFCLRGDTAQRPGIRWAHRLSPQRLFRFDQLPCGRKVFTVPMFGDRISRIGFSFAEAHAFAFGWFCLVWPKFFHQPCFCWFTSERQDSSRGLPFAAMFLYRKRNLTASPRFLVYEPGGESW